MADIKIEIDLGKLEREIDELEVVISEAKKVLIAAENEKTLKLQLKEYILSHYQSSTKTTKTLSIFPELTKTSVSGEVGQPTGISDFIREYIKGHNGCHTKDIVKAYAIHKGVKVDSKFSKVVSRSLTRLKNTGEIINKLREGGKRAGSNWAHFKSDNTMD